MIIYMKPSILFILISLARNIINIKLINKYIEKVKNVWNKIGNKLLTSRTRDNENIFISS